MTDQVMDACTRVDLRVRTTVGVTVGVRLGSDLREVSARDRRTGKAVCAEREQRPYAPYGARGGAQHAPARAYRLPELPGRNGGRPVCAGRADSRRCIVHTPTI